MEQLPLYLIMAGIIVLLFSIFQYGNLERRDTKNSGNRNRFKPSRFQPRQPGNEKVKGDDFEKYVAKLFAQPPFKLKEWRGDKFVDGIYPESNLDPDMEWELKTKFGTFHFAVECKWRNSFTDDKLQWANDNQLARYKRFQANKRMAVFILIGIGGSPSNPGELYILPLQHINDTELNRSQLSPFKRYSCSKQFFFNTNNMMLE